MHRLLAAVALFCLALLGIPAYAAEAVSIDHGLLQAAGSPAQAVTLPHRIYRPERVFARYRLEAVFDAPPALLAARTVLQLDSWPDGGRIELNGVEIADEPTSTPALVVRNLHPFLFVLPRELLRAHDNRLVMSWGSRETLVLVPRMQIGERALLEQLHQRQLFWDLTVVQASLVFAAVVAVVMLGVWWRQQGRDPPLEYLLIGASALGWIVFNTALLWSPVAAEWFLWRRMVGFAGIGAFVMGMWVSLVRLGGWSSPAFEWVCGGWVLLGPLLMGVGFALTGATHLRVVEMMWAVGAAGLGLVPLVVLLRAAAKAPTPRIATLLGVVFVGVGLAAREALIYVFRDPIGTVHIGIQVLAPVWLAAACGILVQDFVRSLREAEAQRAALDRRLAEREAELARLHARERELATDEERRRIMQDMHDGLGSQLVSSLALAESGELTAAQTAELLRACIDDLRLAIDTLGEGRIDLGVAAGNLRFRMEPRLRSAGMKVRWDMSRLPDTLSLPGTEALPVLRVMQEALANATRHAGAKALQVGLACEGNHLVLEVADDGRGFDLQHHAPGKGLAGMQKRARALGAQLELESTPQGTRVRLRVPLPPAAAGPAPAESAPA